MPSTISLKCRPRWAEICTCEDGNLARHRSESGLAPIDWPDFLAECAHHNPAVAEWSDSTKAKLFLVIVRILAECIFQPIVDGISG